MIAGDIRKRIGKKARALTDSLRRHGRPSPPSSVSATDTTGGSSSAARDMAGGVAQVSPVNQSSHQTTAPTPTIRVSLEQQFSSPTASANAVSLPEKNRPLTDVCVLHYANLTMLMYPASRTLLSRRNQMLPKDQRHRCGKRRSKNFLTMTKKAFHSPMTTGATIWKEFWRRR